MSIDSINLVVWVAIGAVTVGLIWFDSKTGELSVARILKSPPYWGVATVIALEAADPSLVPALIIAPATMAGIAFYLLLKPSNFPAAFIILSLIYFFNRKKEGILRRAFLDWLEPILLGMLLITTLLATAMWFIPRSNWRWLLWLDDGALQVHSFLEAVLPKSLWAKSILLFGIALVNASLPRLRKWTDKFNRVLKGLKRGAGTVAIFVSMTIFAHGQSGEIGEKVADEKFERLKPSAEAMAQLAISTRVASNPGAETNDAQEWLNSIAYGVKA